MVVRLSLLFLPFQLWGRAAGWLLRRRPSAISSHAALQDVVWAVSRVSRAIPGATCLTQALAAQLLLSRRGLPSRLRIGVARGSGPALRAHAWLESDGVIVIGGSGVEAYTPLSAPVSNGRDLFVRNVGAIQEHDMVTFTVGDA
jgi:Transglutaminase-like superfamily